jgi:hypothetical protein
MVIPLQDAIQKSKGVNDALLKNIENSYKLRVDWQSDGLKLLGDDIEQLEKAKPILEDITRVLCGVQHDLYWMSVLPSYSFRFDTPASIIDSSLLKIPYFAENWYELHAVVWDLRSLQWLTKRPTCTNIINWPEDFEHPWALKVKIRYGDQPRIPGFWYDASNNDHVDLLTSISDLHDNNIERWVNEVDPNTEDLLSNPSNIDEDPKIDSEHEEINRTDIEEFNRQLNNQNDDDTFMDNLKLQKSGKKSKRRPDFMYQLLVNLSDLLALLQVSEHSGCSFNVHIGTFFVKSSTIPMQYRTQKTRPNPPFSPDEWNTVFLPSKACSDNVLFSPRLTTEVEEAEFLSGFPTSHQPPVFPFNQKCKSDTSSYRITCFIQSTRSEVVIEVDQHSKTTIRSPEREIGFVDVHFPKHVWDGRFSATVNRALRDVEIEAIRPVVKNMWIGELPKENGDNIQRLFSCKTSNVSIRSVELRRERVYLAKNTDKKVLLHVTHIEQLAILYFKDGFCASPHLINTEQHAWFEACISSRDLISILPPVNNTKYSFPRSERINVEEANQEDPTVIDSAQSVTQDTSANNGDFYEAFRGIISPMFDVLTTVIANIDNVGARSRNKLPRGSSNHSKSTGKPGRSDLNGAKEKR